MSSNTKQQNKPLSEIHKHFIGKKRLIVGLLIILVLACIACLSIYIYQINNQSSPNKSKTTYSKTDNIDINKIVEQKMSNGGKAEAQAYLDEKLNAASNSESRAVIYLDMSSLASSDDKSDTSSLDYAIKAENSYPTYESAFIIARIYEEMGDTVSAIKYYKLYLERFDIYRKANTVEPSSDGYDYYSDHLKNLESSL